MPPALRDVLEAQGAELVLHGHNHEHMLNTLTSRFGTVHVLGVPSASLIQSEHHPVAAWNLYRIQRQGGKWQIEVTRAQFRPGHTPGRADHRIRAFFLSGGWARLPP